jgi:hypothetical protein
MVVLVLANLIRMNMWLIDIGKKLDYLYDGKVEEQKIQEHILDQIQSRFALPVKNNSEEVKEWDES